MACERVRGLVSGLGRSRPHARLVRRAQGTLHRSTCRSLTEDARAWPTALSSVYGTTLDKFRESASKYGVANDYKVCRHCCKDVTVTGQNMQAKKPQKATRIDLTIMLSESAVQALSAQYGIVKKNPDELRRVLHGLLGADIESIVADHQASKQEEKKERETGT